MKTIQAKRLEKLIKHFPQARIGVIGDMTADIFIYAKPYRLSREAPVIVVRYDHEKLVPGGAANTVNNLLDLGVEVCPVGVLGEDRAGKDLYDYLNDKFTQMDGMIIDPDFNANINTQYNCEKEFKHDEETEGLLDVLINNDTQHNEPSKSHTERHRDIEDSGNLLEFLKSTFENENHFEINSDSLNILQITFNHSTSPLEIEIKHHPEFNRISVKSYFEYIRESAPKLLSFAGEDDFTSSLGVTKDNGKKMFVIHKTLPTLQISPKKISEMVFQSISEMLEINEIIESHKCDNDH